MNESKTPRTDAEQTYLLHPESGMKLVLQDFARDLERELTESEGTVYVQKLLIEFQDRKLQAIHALVEGDADGTIDATPYEKLCNEIAGLTGITL